MNPGILWKYTSGIFEVYLKCNSFKKINFTRKEVLNNFLKSENKELRYDLRKTWKTLRNKQQGCKNVLLIMGL